MGKRTLSRRLLSFVYLCVLFGVAGWIYRGIQRFDGVILVGEGAAEGVVIKPSEEGMRLTAGPGNLPAEVIAFDNPALFRRFLGDQAVFDARELPFRLRLDDIEVLAERPPRELVEGFEQGNAVVCDANPGAVLPAGGDVFTVGEVRRWSGLIRNAQGRPMASVSLRRAGENWTEHVFLDAGSWRFVDPGIALMLRWFSSESDARAALPKTGADAEGARWGVAEGKKVHWFQSLQPGAGIELDDGTEVTLLRHESEHRSAQGVCPAVLVELRRASGTEQVWVEANRHTADALLRYEDPAHATAVFVLHAWRDGAALMAAFHCQKPFGHVMGLERMVWRPEVDGGKPFPFEVRLDQVMHTALPVIGAGDPVYEVILQTPSGDLPLREGEMVSWKHLRFRYRRQAAPPLVRQRFTVVPPGGGKRWRFTLEPGGRQRVGAWHFSQVTEHAQAADSALLSARRGWGGPMEWMGAGILAAGVFGLAWLRGRRRVFRSRPPNILGEH